jgi:hypothetical protein
MAHRAAARFTECICPPKDVRRRGFGLRRPFDEWCPRPAGRRSVPRPPRKNTRRACASLARCQHLTSTFSPMATGWNNGARRPRPPPSHARRSACDDLRGAFLPPAGAISMAQEAQYGRIEGRRILEDREVAHVRQDHKLCMRDRRSETASVLRLDDLLVLPVRDRGRHANRS